MLALVRTIAMDRPVIPNTDTGAIDVDIGCNCGTVLPLSLGIFWKDGDFPWIFLGIICRQAHVVDPLGAKPFLQVVLPFLVTLNEVLQHFPERLGLDVGETPYKIGIFALGHAQFYATIVVGPAKGRGIDVHWIVVLQMDGMAHPKGSHVGSHIIHATRRVQVEVGILGNAAHVAGDEEDLFPILGAAGRRQRLL